MATLAPEEDLGKRGHRGNTAKLERRKKKAAEPLVLMLNTKKNLICGEKTKQEQARQKSQAISKKYHWGKEVGGEKRPRVCLTREKTAPTEKSWSLWKTATKEETGKGIEGTVSQE